MGQPSIEGHEKLIRIRPYRPSDSEQVRELFKVGILHGPNSPLQVAYIAQMRGPTAYLSYCALLLGLLLVTFPTSTRIRYIGIALCIVGCALFAALRFKLSSAVSGFVKQALNGDLKDIDKTFGMEPIVNHNGESSGDYVPNGSSGFWVAEAFEKSSEMNKTDIIGCVGIDANKNSDKTSVELRRMVVSPDYRRRGIAISLIKTALHHAKSHGVTSVVLSTSMFQPAAISMYERLGWVLQKKVGVWIMLDRVWATFYSLDLTTAKV